MKKTRILLVGLLVWSSSFNVGLQAQEKKVFTHEVDIRPGREDALLDIFKPISEQFDNEFRALGTAYTTGEILYHERRYEDAARNFSTVISKGHKYAYMSDSARLRLAQSDLRKGDADEALRIGREVAS